MKKFLIAMLVAVGSMTSPAKAHDNNFAVGAAIIGGALVASTIATSVYGQQPVMIAQPVNYGYAPAYNQGYWVQTPVIIQQPAYGYGYGYRRHW